MIMSILREGVEYDLRNPLEGLRLEDIASVEHAIRSVTTTPIFMRRRDVRIQTKFDGRKIFAAIYKALNSVPDFHEDIIPGTPLHYAGVKKAEEAALHVYKDVIARINGRFDSLSVPPNVYQVQDIVTDSLRDLGLTKAVDNYYLYSSIKDAHRRGELTDSQYKEAMRLCALGGIHQPSLDEEKAWYAELGCSTLEGLNEKIQSGNLQELIEKQNRRYEQKLDQLAGQIAERYTKQGIRILVVAGPSSSGKTWLANKLQRKLNIKGVPAHPIHIDNFFWPFHQHHLTGSISPDYEQSTALDIPAITEFIYRLLTKGKATQPVYDFSATTTSTKEVEFPNGGLAIIDSHMGMFPPMLGPFDENIVFRTYIENTHGFEGIYAEDIRLLRRSMRDVRERGHSTFATIQGWRNVQRGVNKYIKPYIVTADHVFNGSLVYDLPFLAKAMQGQFIDPSVFVNSDPNQDAYVRATRIKTNILDRLDVASQREDLKSLFSALSKYDPVREFMGQNTPEESKVLKFDEYPQEHKYAAGV